MANERAFRCGSVSEAGGHLIGAPHHMIINQDRQDTRRPRTVRYKSDEREDD